MISRSTREFWQQKLLDDAADPDRVAIIDGVHYYIDDEDSRFKGFDGAKFVIKFHDGREVTTTNLWCQGEIPDEFKDLFPNNADFDWQWKQIGSCRHLVPKNEDIILKGECPLCTLPWEVKVKKEDLEAYRNGKPIYTCFPYLSESERELLITGICDTCWQTKLHCDEDI